MSGVFRTLLDRLTGRLRRPVPRSFETSAPADTEPRRLDIVLSELPPDWVESLETAEPSTDYDVRSLGEPIDPVGPKR